VGSVKPSVTLGYSNSTQLQDEESDNCLDGRTDPSSVSSWREWRCHRHW